MKYIAYCRKSTDEKDKQVLSIESQIAELKEFAGKEKLEVIEWIIESKTAKIPGRKRFEETLRLVESGKAEGLLAWHPDRLARNSVDGGRIIYLLDTRKLLNLKFPTFWFENTPQGKFMLNIAFGQSKYYVDNLSENVSRGLRQKIRNGVWPGKAPHGYFNCPQTRTIKIDKKRSLVVKQAFELFATGKYSYHEIGKFLASHGIHGRSREVLHQTPVKIMLTNPFYVGVLTYSGEKHKGVHKQFISRGLFDQVQEQVKFKSKPRKGGHNFAFTGLVRCRECGGAITAEEHIKHYPTTRGEVRYVYYRCSKKFGKCSQPFIPEDKLVGQLQSRITDIALPAPWARDWLIWAKEEYQIDRQGCDQRVKQIEGELKSAEEKTDRLLDLYLEQTLAEEIYRKKQNQLFDEKTILVGQLKKIREGGSSWLEPFREFVKEAADAAKIARKENTNGKICDFAKRVGSNYLLDQGKIIIEYKRPFASLRAAALARASLPAHLRNSISVGPIGLEPMTFSMSMKRATNCATGPSRVYFTKKQRVGIYLTGGAGGGVFVTHHVSGPTPFGVGPEGATLLLAPLFEDGEPGVGIGDVLSD